ncbi:UBC27 [Symbiodinium sp. CCMP2592]|nr:UBC27 [Symbiodinium sp. CCMP2592]
MTLKTQRESCSLLPSSIAAAVVWTDCQILVQKIVDMGFTQEQAKSALEKHGYDETTVCVSERVLPAKALNSLLDNARNQRSNRSVELQLGHGSDNLVIVQNVQPLQLDVVASSRTSATAARDFLSQFYAASEYSYRRREDTGSVLDFRGLCSVGKGALPTLTRCFADCEAAKRPGLKVVTKMAESPGEPSNCGWSLYLDGEVVTLAERKAAQRAETLQALADRCKQSEGRASKMCQGLAVGLLADLKTACGTAHELGTWGTVVPGVFAGSDEDMDDVLAMLATLMAEDRKSTNLGFQKIEWCKAQAPTQWVEQPSRFGSHMHIRVHWSDADAAYFG